MSRLITSLYPYGTRNTTIANNTLRTPIASVDPVVKLNDPTTADNRQVLYKKRQLKADSQEFLQTYQEHCQSLRQTASALSQDSRQSIWRRTDQAPAAEDLAQSVGRLVDAQQSALSLLSQNTGRSPHIANILQTLSTPASEQLSALSSIGLNYTDSGALTLDKSRLTEAYSKDPQKVKSLLGGKNSLAEHVLKQSNHALNKPSMALVSETQPAKAAESAPAFAAKGRPPVVGAAAIGLFLDVRA